MSLLEYSKTYKPFKYPWAMQIAKDHENQLHWHEGEANCSPDVDQWKSGKIVPWEKNHITQLLRVFTQSDQQVASNYCDLFIPKFKNNEVRSMLISFAAREGVHQRAYSLLNDTLGFPEEEYSAFLEYSEMAEKIEFMQDNDTSTLKGLGLALAQTVCNEGMSLFSAFIMLLNYQRTGKMQGMCEVVLWSIVDESCHVDGMTQLFRAFCEEHPRVVNNDFKKSIYDMYRTAVSLEDKLIDLAYEMGEPENLSKQEVKDYMRFLANRRLTGLGLKEIWDIPNNPCQWFDWLVNGSSLGNFFETKVTDYSSEGLIGDDWGY